MSKYVTLGATRAPVRTAPVRTAPIVQAVSKTKASPTLSDYLRWYTIWQQKGSLTRSEVGSSDGADILNILFPHKNDVAWAPVGMHADILKVYNSPAYQTFLQGKKPFPVVPVVVGVAALGIGAFLLKG